MNDDREQLRQRRSRRRRRGGSGGRSDVASPARREPERVPPAMPDWRWRSFPVFFAFAVGILVMGLAVASPVLSIAVFVAGIFGVAFGLAHIATRVIVARRRQR